MATKNAQELNRIISNGYNMKVISINKTHVTILVGGSKAAISLLGIRPVSALINEFRSGLGCSMMESADIESVDEWQYGK